MTQTAKYIKVLADLKAGDLGLLRTHAGQDLDESLEGFDLFTGIWWPLRQKSQRAPRRSVAWLIAKLFAFKPIPSSKGELFASQLAKCQPKGKRNRDRFRKKFDELLCMSLDKIEPALHWSLGILHSNDLKIDWVKLADDLSVWERESTRIRWANEFLGNF